MKLKQWLAFGCACAISLSLAGCGSSGSAVYVQSVETLSNLGGIAPGDRFAGLVVSENVTEIKKDGDKAIAELLVKEGDDVKEGQELFSYDTDELELALEKTQLEVEKMQNEMLEDYGSMILKGKDGIQIMLLSIIGEVEGHEAAPDRNKATKYDHVLPYLAAFENDPSLDGLLVLLNTQGGDVDAGLAIAEMIATLSKPTVSLVLGGSHSIGVPLAVSTDYAFIVPSGTMLIHPVRMGGMVIGAPQSYAYFKRIQDRITEFIERHSRTSKMRLEEMMMDNTELTKDLGTILVGEEAVREGLINEVGGIGKAFDKLHQMIREKR